MFIPQHEKPNLTKPCDICKICNTKTVINQPQNIVYVNPSKANVL